MHVLQVALQAEGHAQSHRGHFGRSLNIADQQGPNGLDSSRLQNLIGVVTQALPLMLKNKHLGFKLLEVDPRPAESVPVLGIPGAGVFILHQKDHRVPINCQIGQMLYGSTKLHSIRSSWS